MTESTPIHAQVPNGPGPRRLSLRFKLGLLLGGVAAFAVLLMGAIEVYYQTEQIRTATDRDNLELAQLVASVTETAVQNTVNDLVVHASSGRFMQDARAHDAAAMNDRLERIAV